MVGKNQDIKIFKKYLNEELFVCENTKRTYTQAVKSFYKDHQSLSQNSVTHFLKTHRRFFYLYALKHLCRSLNMNEKDIRFPKGNQVELTRKKQRNIEWSRLYEIMEELIPLAEDRGFKDIKHIIRILYYTGCRIREVLELKLRDIYRDKNGRYYVHLFTKREIRRECPIPTEYAEELLKFVVEDQGRLNNQDCFYTGYTKSIINKYEISIVNGKPVKNEKGVLKLRMAKYTKFKRQIEECNKDLFNEIKKTHRFRRGIINELQRKGVDIYSIASFMGHSNVETTKRYFDETAKERAIEKCFFVLNKDDEKKEKENKEKQALN